MIFDALLSDFRAAGLTVPDFVLNLMSGRIPGFTMSGLAADVEKTWLDVAFGPLRACQNNYVKFQPEAVPHYQAFNVWRLGNQKWMNIAWKQIPAVKDIDLKSCSDRFSFIDFKTRTFHDALLIELETIGFVSMRSQMITGGAGVVRQWVCRLSHCDLVVNDFNDDPKIRSKIYQVLNLVRDGFKVEIPFGAMLPGLEFYHMVSRPEEIQLWLLALKTLLTRLKRELMLSSAGTTKTAGLPSLP